MKILDLFENSVSFLTGLTTLRVKTLQSCDLTKVGVRRTEIFEHLYYSTSGGGKIFHIGCKKTKRLSKKSKNCLMTFAVMDTRENLPPYCALRCGA